MTLEQMAIVRNMLGFLHEPRKTYRNRYVAHPNDRLLKEMAEAGIVEREDAFDERYAYYRVTKPWLEAMGVEVSK